MIDFNTVELCDDFSLQISELEHLKISELLKYDKNLITDERLKYFIGKIPFAVILDTMRLAILKNIEKITSVKEAIYMDFDILPNENQESIKIINISKNILMADGLQNEKDISGPIENSIIAINEFSEPILSEMINEIQTMFYHYAIPDFQMSDGAVFGIMKEVITDHVHSELFGIPIEKLRSMRQKDFWDYQKIIKKNDEKHRVNHDALWKSYVFQKNGGNVKLTQDNSWKKRVDLYNKPILPLVFGKISANEFYIVTSLKQTLSALNSDPRIFDGTLNHSDGALIGHTLRSCLPWKSSDTTP